MNQSKNDSPHVGTIIGRVEAQVNYLAATQEKPVAFTYKTENGESQRTYQTIKHTMAILNGRTVNEHLTLEGQGFALVQHPTAIANFYDVAEVRAVYYPEVERLVKQATGAVRVLVFDHTVRCGPNAKERHNGVREPVRFAHNDYTLNSGPQRVHDLMGDEAEALLKNRFVFINVWRPIRGPVEEAPLAVCDARSMRLADFVPTDLKYPDRTGEVYSVAFNPEHRWLYFPRMERDEALLLKCYDSSVDGGARWTAHTAFDDPTAPADPFHARVSRLARSPFSHPSRRPSCLKHCFTGATDRGCYCSSFKSRYPGSSRPCWDQKVDSRNLERRVSRRCVQDRIIRRLPWPCGSASLHLSSVMMP
jgi:hypothetical protein